MKYSSSFFFIGSIFFILACGAQAQVPTFSASSLSVAGVNEAFAVASGDFNGDGKRDLAVTNFSGAITIWLGDGTGAYTQASGSPLTAAIGISSLAVTDLNGDGKSDLVAVIYQGSSTNDVFVWLGNGNGTFQTVQQFSTGGGPDFVAVGDFNRDGKPDLAIANLVTNNVSVFLNTTASLAATVSFTSPTGSPFPAGTSPESIALADFNGDGYLDMAIADEAVSGAVTVLLGNGSGGFTAASYSPISVGKLNASVVAGDFNGDGKPDLAIASFGNDSLIVLLGSGSGFTAATGSPYATEHQPNSVTAGDFNGDGNLDVALANSGGGSVTVFLGNGSGAFTAASGNPFSVGTNPQFLMTGDFNLDGEPDLAVAVFGANKVTLLLNTSPAITANPASVTFYAQLSGSSALAGAAIISGGTGYSVSDIVTASQGGATQARFQVTAIGAGGAVASIVPVAVGQGYSVGQTLTFTGGTGSGLTAQVTTVGDAGAVAAPAAVSVSVNSTVAGFNYSAVANQPWLTPSPASNATGALSTVTLSPSQGKMPAGIYSATARYTSPNFFGAKTNTVLSVSNPSGTLTPAASVSLPVASGIVTSSLAVGDFNRDGNPDLVVALGGANGNTVNVLLGDGAGGFATPGTMIAAGASPSFVAVGDFNGDGKPDLAIANSLASGTLTVLLGDGAGGFSPAPGSPFAVGANPQFLAIGDFNGDGNADVAVSNFTSKDVTVLLGNGLGGFAPAPGSPIASVQNPAAVAVGDFNGDGKLDLAVACNHCVAVLLGNGVGGFTAAPNSPYALGKVISAVVVADFNGDGKQDFATTNFDDNSVSVLLGDGTGSFNPATNSPFPAGLFPDSLAVADFNGDGRPDLAIANFQGPPYGATVLLGNGTGGFSQAAGSPFPAIVAPVLVVTGDFNRDGRADLLVLDDHLTANTISVLLGALAPTASVLSGPSAATFGASGTLVAAVAGIAFHPLTGSVSLLEGGSTIATVPLPAASHIAGIASSGGLIEIDAPGHGLSSSGTVVITGVTGTTEANGTWIVAVLDADHFTLAGSTFTNAYTGGGVVQPAAQFPISILGGGTHQLTAVYPGDARYLSSTSGALAITITQAPQTIAFAAITTQISGSAALTLTATASSGLPVGFASNSASICTVSGNTLTLAGGLTAKGTCSITATQPGGGPWAAASPVTVTFTVDTPFGDVSSANETQTFITAINDMLSKGITSGCTALPLEYCPTLNVTRGQMAVFIIRSIYGSNNFSYNPAPYFTDATPADVGSFFPYIQKMHELGITSGCTTTTYCPDLNVTRGQMAVFIIRARYGTSFNFDFPSTPLFTDATAASVGSFFKYIQRMKVDNITSGCTTITYCPDLVVTRDQMAVFMIRGGFNQLLPPTEPIISSALPATGGLGETINVTLTGVNTNFVQGTTTVSAGAGLTVGTVTVNSLTSLTVQLTIAAGATPNPVSLLATTGTEEAVLPNGFTITSDPASGAIAYWNGNGATANSISGMSGTLISGATYASDPIRLQGVPDAQAFSLNGTNSYVQAAAGETAAVSGARTLVAWVYPNANSGLGMPILTGGATLAAGDIFGITGTTGTCSTGGQYQLYVDGAGTCYVSNNFLAPDQWSLVAVTFDGTSAVFYINGVASVAVPAVMSSYGLATYEIGGNTLAGTSSGASFHGLLSEVQVYNRALTPAEIQGLYAP